ncbi:MAG: XRE family transcriptional regulator [Acidiferrobacterales bacterium]|nr:XRE family transcriptional regulator [Acidiferrobacterales bacterium]
MTKVGDKSEFETKAQRLGAEIREVRKARGFTLSALCENVGCSVAYLSRIERGAAKISVELLSEISDALAVDSAWFFPKQSGGGPLERSHVVRADSRRPLSNMYTRSSEELGFEDELLSSTISGGCYLLLSRFAPGKGSPPESDEGYEFEGEQHGVIISGEVILVLGKESILLGPGDSFSYPSTIPHRFYNNGESEATMVWAMAPVRISW